MKKKQTFQSVLASHELRDEKRDKQSIERDERIENKVDEAHKDITQIYGSIPEHIATAVEKSVKATVNGKVDKVNNNIKWILIIGGFVIPLALGAFAWSIQWEIATSNQMSAVAQAVEDLKNSK